MADIKFINYDGAYPNLCSGTLEIEIDGVRYCEGFNLCSGGSVSFTSDWDAVVTSGSWSVSVPNELEKYREQIEDLVNENVPWGCCGGCI